MKQIMGFRVHNDHCIETRRAKSTLILDGEVRKGGTQHCDDHAFTPYLLSGRIGDPTS